MLELLLSIDLAQLQTQVGQTTTAIANSPAGPALDTAKDTGFASLIAKNATDALHAAWGGDRTKHPPPWVLILAAFSFGIIGVGLALAMKGLNPFDPASIAAALGLGVTAAGPGAIATTQIHQLARPDGEPPPSPEPSQPTMHIEAPVQVKASAPLPPREEAVVTRTPVPPQLRSRSLAPWLQHQ